MLVAFKDENKTIKADSQLNSEAQAETGTEVTRERPLRSASSVKTTLWQGAGTKDKRLKKKKKHSQTSYKHMLALVTRWVSYADGANSLTDPSLLH